ncbi:MAG: RNA polymerase sigma factor [Jatrophihabitantaceae bacterium]
MGVDERSDAELLARSRLRPEVLGELYERHAGAVYRYLARRVGQSVAEDLLSEVFLAAMDARMRVVPHASGSALPWLYGIAGNVLRAHLRRTTRREGTGHDQTMDWDAVDSRVDAEAKRAQLRAALGQLTPGERELLLLVAWEGLTPAEAARALGINQVAARSRLHRARQRAQQSLATSGSPAATSAIEHITTRRT